jgi:hypothetical protein
MLWLMLAVAVGCVLVPPAARAYTEYRERREMEELIRLILDTVAPNT